MDDLSSLKQLRTTGTLEGLSFLVLLFVAMPMKYLLGEPLLVRIVGMAHGGLFLAYVFFLVRAAVDREWPLTRALLGFVASVLPFGVFFFDATLRRELGEARPVEEASSSR